jgi:hypothetical protein
MATMAPVASQMRREQLLLDEEMVILSIASFVSIQKNPEKGSI